MIMTRIILSGISVLMRISEVIRAFKVSEMTTKLL